jgi:D-glycero-D-manno-heptose 1,7-bisphosphate phosphatase
MEKKRILCLDLDGTVRRSKSGKTFIEGPDDVEIIPGMKELIWNYRDQDYMVYGITNQGGVAMGFKTYNEMAEEIYKTENLLRKEPFEHCFHSIMACCMHADGQVPEYSYRSLCRKPYIGMLVQIEDRILEVGDLPDWDNSLFVGDRPEDEQCAKSAGIPFMWAHDFLKQASLTERLGITDIAPKQSD